MARQSARHQVREALGRIDGLFAKAGTDKNRILHVQIWLDDVRDVDAVNAGWDAHRTRAGAFVRLGMHGQIRHAYRTDRHCGDLIVLVAPGVIRHLTGFGGDR